MRRSILFLLLIVISCSAVAQADTLTVIDARTHSNADFEFSRFIPGRFTSVYVDVLDNVFLITAGNQLKKLNPNGDSVAVFNDVKKYGNPTHLDVSNPLKVLMYYRNFSTVVILDRLLAIRNSINFRKQNIFTVQAIATSYDNNIWLFDEQDFKLKKIDDDGKLLQESTDMRLLVDSVPSPTQIIDSDNQVFLYDEERGFFVFDYYGALKNKLPFLHWSNPAVARNRMYGFDGNKLYSYEMKTLNLREYQLPSFFSNYLSIRAINGKVYLLKENGLEIYSVK